MVTPTTSRTGASTGRQTGRPASAGVDDTQPIWSKLKSAGRGISSVVPSIDIPQNLRREAMGVALALAAGLTGWTLWSGGSDGRLTAIWQEALAFCLGRGAFVAPILAVLVAYRAFASGDGRVLLHRHIAGGILFTMACSGLIALAGRLAPRHPGGWIGHLTGKWTSALIGSVGGGVLLFVAGGIGVFLMTGTDVRMLVRDVRSLFPARAKKSASVERQSIASGSDDVPVVRPTVPRRSGPERAVGPAPTPVINRSHLEKTPKAPAGPPVVASPVTAGTPMPLPDVTKLALYDGVKLDEGDLTTKARRIEETLASFKVEARVREINPGPAVTQYTLEPGVGTKVSRITTLQNDLALALAAPSIRIEAPVPGMARVGIEIPNAKVFTVGLRETLESDQFASGEQKLPIPLGRDVNGNYIIHDLTKMPHLLIAGATGSGKSVCLTAIISTFLLTRGPDQLRMLMIDPKMVELTGYNGVPHLQCPVVTEMDKVVGALRLVLQEMERRYTLFSKLGVRNLDGYRMRMADEPNAEAIPYLVVIIDELADLMMTSPDDVESLLCRLAQMGRASGIHLIIATQRPSVDVLTGLIKANVPARIAFAVTSLTDSRVVLDLPGAERLLGRGDMLFLPPDAAKPQRIQGAFVEDRDVQNIVQHWHEVTPVPQYAEAWLNLNSPSSDDGGDGEEDALMEQARGIVRQQGTASASMLQRRLRIGYNRAARIIECMEDEGLIGPADGIKGRPVLSEY